MKKIVIAFCIIIICSVAKNAHSFSVSPKGTSLDRYIAYDNAGWWDKILIKIANKGINKFKEPVHEEITNRIYGCNDIGNGICQTFDDGTYAPFGVLAGVRWNDDPPFNESNSQYSSCKNDQTIRFISQPLCWGDYFLGAEKNPEIYDQDHHQSNIMLRSHFGDLQFLHAMSSNQNETYVETFNKMLMWAEFTWKISIGDKEYRQDKLLKDIKINGFSNHFGKMGMNIQDLFAQGNPPLRKQISEVAFGSLLHMTEDSVAKGHSLRNGSINKMVANCPSGTAGKLGTIGKYYLYINQDKDNHDSYDIRRAFINHMTEDPNIVDIGREIYEFYSDKKSWEAVRPYFECVFATDIAQTQ